MVNGSVFLNVFLSVCFLIILFIEVVSIIIDRLIRFIDVMCVVRLMIN